MLPSPARRRKKKRPRARLPRRLKRRVRNNMSSLQAPLFASKGESKGQCDLPEGIFSPVGSRRVLQEVIVGLQANQRSGTSMTKTRGRVSGGGRKPWKQKGTGNARSGSIRSP